jgi:DNA modification methylase
MSTSWKNQLYFGDNLDILKDLHKQHPEGFIDLIYIDPPFNSKRNYNVLCKFQFNYIPLFQLRSTSLHKSI